MISDGNLDEEDSIMFKLWICICARGFGPPWTMAEGLKFEAVCYNYAIKMGLH